jgi:cytochrome b6-f complex iron-sulfur subunit
MGWSESGDKVGSYPMTEKDGNSPENPAKDSGQSGEEKNNPKASRSSSSDHSSGGSSSRDKASAPKKEQGASKKSLSKEETKRPFSAGNTGAGGMRAPNAGKGKASAPVPPAGVASKREGDRPAAGIERRGFIGWLGIGWIAFIAMNGAALTALLRFFFPNVLFEPPMKFRAGKPEEFAPGMVDTRYKDKFGVWIVRLGDRIFALSTVCTHLGCTPSWLAADEKFKCPCHGSGFYITGLHFEGPAPRPLERYKVSIDADGFVVVDKTKKFLKKAEWSNDEAYVTA